MTTPAWPSGLGALIEHLPVLAGVIIGIYVCLIAVAAVVGALHPDGKRRAAALKVLERLLGHGRRTRP
jgi:hypothetical protein